MNTEFNNNNNKNDEIPDNPDHPFNPDKPDDPFDAETFLYIRTHNADNGTVPLPSGLPFWISPDISIIRPGGIRDSKAIADVVNQVEVIVTNRGGIDAINVFVDVFMTYPSTAFTPATAQLIGSGFIDVQNYNTGTLLFPWTPSAAEAGHKCLLARAFLSMPPDGYADGTTFDVRGDRHIAQRNIHIVDSNSQSQSFKFNIVNAFNKESEFVIKYRELNNSDDLKMIQTALGSQFVNLSKKPLKSMSLKNTEAPKSFFEQILEFFTQLLKAIISFILGLFGLNKNKKPEYKTSSKFQMKKDDVKEEFINIESNSSASAGEINIIEIQQVDTNSEKVVGGLWVVVLNN